MIGVDDDKVIVRIFDYTGKFKENITRKQLSLMKNPKPKS